VERYLERSFYNHAALTPADWNTYCQLATLAHERHGLHVPAPALPEHKLSEGGLLPCAHRFHDCCDTELWSYGVIQVMQPHDACTERAFRITVISSI